MSNIRNEHYWYDFSAIKEAADCRSIAKNFLGLELNGQHRCAAVWRDGKNPNVYIDEKYFKDHKTGDSGSVLDLVAIAKGWHIEESAEALGDYLGIERTIPSGIEVVAPERKKVAEWIYTNEAGEEIHKVVRFDELEHDGSPRIKSDGKIAKTFRQYHFSKDEAKWLAGLNGVQCYPLYWKELHSKSELWICEGEKAAAAGFTQGLPCTTFTNGAANFKDYYKDYIKDKDIILLPDNDDAGQLHANKLSFEFKDVAKSIKIMLVCEKKKGDLADYFEDGGDVDALRKKVDQVDVVEKEKVQEPSSNRVESALEKAKILNREPLTNFIEKDIAVGGKSVKFYEPKTMRQLMHEIYERCLNYPRVVADTIFDFNRETQEINMLVSVEAFVGWLNSTTRNPINFKKGPQFIKPPELFCEFKRQGRRYRGVSYSATYPENHNYFNPTIQMNEFKPSKDHHHFEHLINFFNPYNSTDRVLIKAFFASALYFRDCVVRPLWIVDSNTGEQQLGSQNHNGKGIGKTTLVKMVAKLIGGNNPNYNQPFACKAEDFLRPQDYEEFKARILSPDGYNKKVVLLDNVSHYFNSDQFAGLLTETAFSGRPKYGRGEITRENDLTFTITCNSGSFSVDIINRAMFICLEKPKNYSGDWVMKIETYLRNYRGLIIADIIDILAKSAKMPEGTQLTRYAVWEKEVLWPMCDANDLVYDTVLNVMRERRDHKDGDKEEGEELCEFIAKALENQGYNPDANLYWIQGTRLREIIHGYNPHFGGYENRNYRKKLIDMIQTNSITRLEAPYKKFPHRQSEKYFDINGNKIRPCKGFLWNPTGKPLRKGGEVEGIIVSDRE